METVIFENGIATSSGVVTAFNYDPATGVFVNTVQESVTAGVGLPAFCTIEQPPGVTEGQGKIARFVSNSWELVDDLRGQTVWSKSTRKAVKITSVGALDDDLTLIAPVTDYDEWQDTAWVTDTVAQKAAQVKETEVLRTTKLAEVNSVTQTWQTQLALGMISASNKNKLINWMAYADQLSAVDTSLAPYVVWPDTPDA